MDQPIQFRTSVGGFHKGDVTEYITKTAAAHQAELREKDHQIEALKKENLALQTLLAETPSKAPSPAPEAPPSAEPEEAPAQPEQPPLNQLELAAYRRAEAAERLALQRSRRLYETLDELCSTTSSEFQTASSAAQNSVNEILAQMELLSQTQKQLEAALSAAREKLGAMDAMIPDPMEELEGAQ